jgi:hypothetical protein
MRQGRAARRAQEMRGMAPMRRIQSGRRAAAQIYSSS